MVNILSNICFLFLFFHTLYAGDLALDPSFFKARKGKSQCEEFSTHKSEIIYDIYYGKNKKDEKILFRVLDKYMFLFNEILIRAQANRSPIYYKNNGHDLFDTTDSLNYSFYFSPKNYETTVVKPEHIKLRRTNKNIHKICLNNGVKIIISQELYTRLKLLKGLATKQHQGIGLNLELLNNSKLNIKDLEENFLLVDAEPSIEIYCCVCLDEKRCIMLEPCNHVCLCAACAKSINKKCPLCLASYETQKIVYF